MITPDKKTKKKNIITALLILAFMVFLFVFTITASSQASNILRCLSEDFAFFECHNTILIFC